VNPFERALEVLDEKGWTQHRFESSDGRLCILGALAEAQNVSRVEILFSEQRTFLRSICGEQPQAFNDDPATSEEDVRLLLKHAAAEWEREHA
jgi:hypothetical protein